MAKPSIRICQNTVTQQASLKNSPPRAAAGGGEVVAFSIGRPSIGGADLDEFRELHLAVGDVRRPQIDLLAVLPLQHEPGNGRAADLKGMRIGRIFAFEFDGPYRAD